MHPLLPSPLELGSLAQLQGPGHGKNGLAIALAGLFVVPALKWVDLERELHAGVLSLKGKEEVDVSAFMHLDSCAHTHYLKSLFLLLRDYGVGDFSCSLFLDDEKGVIMLYAGCLYLIAGI